MKVKDVRHLSIFLEYLIALGDQLLEPEGSESTLDVI